MVVHRCLVAKRGIINKSVNISYANKDIPPTTHRIALIHVHCKSFSGKIKSTLPFNSIEPPQGNAILVLPCPNQANQRKTFPRRSVCFYNRSYNNSDLVRLLKEARVSTGSRTHILSSTKHDNVDNLTRVREPYRDIITPFDLNQGRTAGIILAFHSFRDKMGSNPVLQKQLHC